MRTGSRKVLFVVTTPVPQYLRVTLFEDSFTTHIVDRHPEMAGRVEDIKQALVGPTCVLIGLPQSNVQFVCDSIVDTKNAPLVVVVNSQYGAVRTAFHKDQFKNFAINRVNPQDIVWRKT